MLDLVAEELEYRSMELLPLYLQVVLTETLQHLMDMCSSKEEE